METLNKYELGVIIRADLDDATQQAEWDKIKALLERFGATIDKEDKWGRRKLAYPIAKQKEGVYTFFTYTAPASTPKEIESRLRIMENVLRFLTINMNEAEARKAKARKNNPTQAVEVAPVVEAPVAETPVEAVPEVTEPVAETPVAEVAVAEAPVAETPEAAE